MKKLLIALLSLSIVACTPLTEEEEHARNCDSKGMHDFWLKTHIKSKLKSPSTASFIGVMDTQFTPMTECRMLIKGYVDSQNGFGATIRTHYTAITRYNAEKKSIVIDSLDL